VVVAVLSVSMSTSAIDSLQNAIVDNISGVYLQHAPLLVVRGLVLLLTVPPMIVSLKASRVVWLPILTTCESVLGACVMPHGVLSCHVSVAPPAELLLAASARRYGSDLALWEMLVPLQSYNIIQLFLIANLVTTTSTLPVLAGLIRHRLAYRCVSFVRCCV